MPSPVPVAFGNPTVSGDIQSPRNKILPPPAEKPSSSESDSSGSNRNASRNNDANDNWQAATSGAQDWATDVPKTPKVPGAWAGSENNAQGAPEWNNNGGETNGRAAQNNGAQGNQNNDSNNGWNNGGAQNNASHPTEPQNGRDNANTAGNGNQNGDWNSKNGGQQQSGWDNANAASNGNGNGDWNNNNGSPQQTGGAELAQQDTWDAGIGAANGNGNQNTRWNENQPAQAQDWGATHENNNAGQAFENPVPAFERPKSKSSVKTKYTNKAPSMAPGFAPSVNAGMAPLNPYLATGPSMPMKLQPKPYWSIWKSGPESGENVPFSEPEVAEGPIYNVPTETAQRHMMSHQVLIGKPAKYVHKTSRPKYMDTHENPYAAFIFNYRSKGTLLRVRREFEANMSARGPRETAGVQLGGQCG